MVRGHDLRALNIYKRMKANLATPIFGGPLPPPWFKAMEMVPPSEILTRPIPPQHRGPNPHAKKPRSIFKPQKIVYEEDELRRDFYKDHPWELARPRVITEIDGKDSWHCDWSKGLIQDGMPLSGESVVQRQLWLMRNTGLSKRHAYDVVRREFYALRQEEEVEVRIAREEAMMVGAYFGKSRLQRGIELEDRAFEAWKYWASKMIAKAEEKRVSAYTSFRVSDAEELDPDPLASVEVEEPEEDD